MHAQDDVVEAAELTRLQAAAALRGVEVRRLPDGAYIVVRWRLAREFASLGAVAAFLASMGVQS